MGRNSIRTEHRSVSLRLEARCQIFYGHWKIAISIKCEMFCFTSKLLNSNQHSLYFTHNRVLFLISWVNVLIALFDVSLIFKTKPEENYYTCSWSYNPDSSDPVIAFAGVKGVIHIVR